MDLIKLSPKNSYWKEFLKTTKHEIVHTPEYKLFIEETFPNTKADYYAITNKEIKMLFPIHHVDQPLIRKIFFAPFFDIFKPKLISASFNDFGGPIGEIKPEYLIPLFKQIKQRHKDINNIEIRHDHPAFSKLIKTKQYQRFIIPLKNKEQVWKNIQKAKRKAIKKSQREGITTREITEQDIPELYNLYLRNMRTFGELPYQKKFFTNFYKHLVNNNLAKVFGAYYNNKLVSALLGYTVKPKTHIIIAVSDKKYLNMRPNDAVHWAFIEWCLDNKYQHFDFGRTRKESGQHEYKRKWGGIPETLTTNYVPITSTEIPVIDPTNPTYKLFIWIEQHLPLIITEHISSWFREGLGI